MLSVPENLEIGKPFQEGLTCYLEGSIFEFNSRGCFLLVAYPMITEKEIESFYDSKVEFNIGVYYDIIFFWKKIQGLRGWSHSTYNYHLIDPKMRPPLKKFQEDRYRNVRMILVDANIGVVRGIREVELAPELSRKLIEETRKQSEKKFGRDSYYMSLGRINSVIAEKMEL